MIRAAFLRYRAAYTGLPREVWLLALVLFVNRAGSMVLPFLTLYLTDQLRMSEAVAGRLISVYGLGAICGAYLGGRLAESFGALRVQTVCMFLAAPAFLLIPLWNTWPPIAASLFGLSLVAEAVRATNATAVAQLTPADSRMRAFALQRLAANLGFSFGPAIGGVLATINFGLLFVVDALTTFVAAVALLRFFRMRRIAPATHAHHEGRIRVSPLKDGVFVAFLGLMLASMIVFFQFGSTYPLYLRDHFRLNTKLIGLMFAVNTSVIVVCEMLLIDAIKSWPLMRTIGWGCFLSCLGFGILPFGSTVDYCVLAMLVLTIGEMLSFALATGFVAKRGPAGGEGSYMGWYMVMFATASVLGPAIGSAIYQVNADAVWIAGLFVGAAVLIGFQILAPYARTDHAEPLVELPDTFEEVSTMEAPTSPPLGGDHLRHEATEELQRAGQC